MTVCLIGKILRINTRSLDISEMSTKEEYTCDYENDDLFDLKVDQQGVFVGELISGRLRLKKVEIRKFLDPLYEDDLYDASGSLTLVPIINDPFTQTYIEFLKRNEQNENTTET